MTTIEWTDETWNPTRGCSRVSPGCDNCYAMRMARRSDVPGGAYEGLTRIGKRGVDWSGKVRLVPEMLGAPLRWKKPRRIFVNSMSDLFHESLSNEEIAAVFGVMARCSRHTFQVLTKRPRRMREWFEWMDSAPCAVPGMESECRRIVCHQAAEKLSAEYAEHMSGGIWWGFQWPLPNVWLGVSVEDQDRYHERIGDLLRTPAAVRFLSLEPLLGPVDLCMGGQSIPDYAPHRPLPKIDWAIVGGESGNGARDCEIVWIRSIVKQCAKAKVSCFVKQIGARPVFRTPLERLEKFGPEPQSWGPGEAELVVTDLSLKSRKGGDIDEWPEDLRVRQFPEVRP